MVHSHLLLTQWLSLWYTTLSYWPTGHLYGTLLSFTGPLDISTVQYPLILVNWLSVWYTTIFYLLDISLVHYPFLLAHWISLWYTTIFYWPTGYPFGTLPSPIDPLVISTDHFWSLAICMVHYYLLLAHSISLWYTTLSYWPTGYPYRTLLSSTGPLDTSVVHYPLLVAQLLSL